jgi:hypothetical protein
MSTEDTGTGQDDQISGSQKETGGVVPGSGNGAGLGIGDANTFEPEEGTDAQSTSAAGEPSVAKAEDTPDVEDTPVDTTEPS